MRQLKVPFRRGARHALVARGITKAVEVGVGAVLCGLMRQIEPNVKMAKFGDPADLEKLNELLS